MSVAVCWLMQTFTPPSVNPLSWQHLLYWGSVHSAVVSQPRTVSVVHVSWMFDAQFAGATHFVVRLSKLQFGAWPESLSVPQQTTPASCGGYEASCTPPSTQSDG